MMTNKGINSKLSGGHCFVIFYEVFFIFLQDSSNKSFQMKDGKSIKQGRTAADEKQ